MAQVALRSIVKMFDKAPAVQGIDLDIADREFIVLVGPSRLYLGQHWLSDVIGGYAVAAMLLAPYCWAYTKWRLDATRRRFKHAKSATDVPTQRRRHIGGPSTAVPVATNHEQ